MSTITTSIDSAAAGFVRHRFIRAMTTAWMVLFVTGTLTLVIASAASGPANDLGVIGKAIVGVNVVLIVGGLLLAVTALAAAIVDRINRRLIAFVGLLFFGAALVILPILVIAAPLSLMGIIESADADPSSPIENAALLIMSVLALLVAWEGVGWAWWQLRIDYQAYLATRGWRPPGWRLLSILRRILGLPAFVSNVGRGRFTLTLLYFGVAIFNVGVAALLALPFLAFTDIKDTTDVYAIAGVGITLAALLVLNVVGAGRYIAQLAGRRATEQYQRVWEFDQRPPIVFLRMFEQDDERLPALVRHPLLRLPAGVSEPRTLDELLLEHGSPYGPVIAIGDPRDSVRPLGAARIFIPEAGLGWQDVVKNLVRASQTVIMCPGDTEGVRWELDLIARQPNLRVAYVANPELSPQTTLRLFRQIIPGGRTLAMPPGEWPIAAYKERREDATTGWRVLTTSIQPSVQTYTLAINMALQSMLGPDGVPLARPRRFRRSHPNSGRRHFRRNAP